MPSPRHIKMRKWENPDYFLCPDSDSDHSHNLIGSKLDQDQSPDYSETSSKSFFL